MLWKLLEFWIKELIKKNDIMTEIWYAWNADGNGMKRDRK